MHNTHAQHIALDIASCTVLHVCILNLYIAVTYKTELYCQTYYCEVFLSTDVQLLILAVPHLAGPTTISYIPEGYFKAQI